MRTKKFIGKLVSLKFTDWKEPFYGFVIDYNDNWTLLKYNPTDFIVDGYIILRNSKIEGYNRGHKEELIEKVIKLKGIDVKSNVSVPLTDLNSILGYITTRFGVFSFYRKWVNELYLGKLLSCNEKIMVCDFLDPQGNWTGEYKVKSNEIRAIEFDTDYITSLKLLSNSIKGQSTISTKSKRK